MTDLAALEAQIAAMSPEQLKRLVAMATPRMTQYIVRTPTAKQRAAMLLNHVRDGFFGGAAGGGKSEWLLMEAAQYANIPGYSAIIFRRTFKDLALPGALMDRAKDWWQGRPDVHWDEQEHRFDFQGGGSLIFGYLEHEDDKRRYQSAEFQFIGFDELTQFTETQFKFLFSRLRRKADVNIPLRMRSASNPGGVGHEWVKTRFVDGAADHPGRFFIRAKIQDNPHLDQDEYIASLEETDPLTRGQMLDGNWDAVPEGKKFKREFLAGKFLVEAPPLKKVVRYWDLAASVVSKRKRDPDFTAGALMGLTRDNRVVVLDMQRFRELPGDVEARIAVTADADGRKIPVWLEQEPGSSGTNTISQYQRHVLQGFVVHGNRSTGSKEERANPLFAQARIGNLYIVQGRWLGALLNEWEAFPDPSWHDDQVDATSGGYFVLSGRRGAPGVRTVS